jgi:hypothetical protein
MTSPVKNDFGREVGGDGAEEVVHSPEGVSKESHGGRLGRGKGAKSLCGRLDRGSIVAIKSYNFNQLT